MDAPYSPLEFQLLNDWQHDFPIVPRPFAAMGEKVMRSGIPGDGVDETAVLAALRHLSARGAISRIGPVFAPGRVGAGALAALAAPAARLDEIAAQVSARPQVNHNYQREHAFNLWFVATAPDRATLAATLAAIETDTGCAVISMPLQREYHIDLGFDLAGGHKGRPSGEHPTAAAVQLDSLDLSLLGALQGGLALVPRPFLAIGERMGLDEDAVCRRVAAFVDAGVIKRFGVVVRHHELGYRANAMVVFDVADDRVDAVGADLAREAGVTLCYRRSRCLPHWHYNLYCMVHGRTRPEVAPVIARLAAQAGSEPQVLFSVRRFKQCGARYFAAPPAAAA